MTTRLHAVGRRQALARLGGLTGLAAGLARAGPTRATDKPGICGQAPHHAYPPHDRAPLIHTWLADGRRDAPLPDCSGLDMPAPALLVRVRGRYQAPGGLDAQLLRQAAVSTRSGATYWSFSEGRRRVLVEQAHAVAALSDPRLRPDFGLDDLKPGVERVFMQQDNRSAAPQPYGLRLLWRSASAWRVRIDNLSELRSLGLTWLAPREARWLLTVEHSGDPARAATTDSASYTCTGLLAVQRLRWGSAERHRLSNLARAVALFDHQTGQQTEIARLAG